MAELLKPCTTEHARMGFAGHGAYLRRLSNMTRKQLKEEYAGEVTVLAGGPRTRDELISALNQIRYPAAERSMWQHVLYHETAGWSACPYCHPHDGERCECELGSQA
jgi:hypothetical protein